MSRIFCHVFDFYRQGFRSMRLGRTLWAIILVKLVVLFVLARVFMPDHLQERFATDRERAAYVLGRLTPLSTRP